MRQGLRWFTVGIAGFLAIALLAAGILYTVGSSRLGRTYEATTAFLEVQGDAASLTRGEHLSRIHGCIDCHGDQLDGRVFVDDPPFRVVASNLTSGAGGVGQTYDATDFDRAIRHGLRPDGSPLLIMPSAAYNRLSDGDAADLIAYLQQLPAVDNELPPTHVRTLGRVLSAFAIDPAFEVRTMRSMTPAQVDRDEAGYGAYLTSITCAYCHGDDLRGGVSPTPGSPPAPDLAPAGLWPYADLARALQSGVTPAGRMMDPQFMPWTFTRHMTPDEVRAIHVHLATLTQ